jgi:hypothetical protein
MNAPWITGVLVMAKEDWKTTIQQLCEKYPRLAGLAITLVALAVCYWLIAIPIQDAAAHARQIDVHFKAMICPVAVAVVGLLVMVVGSSLKSWVQSSPTIGKAVGIGILAFALIIGIVVAESVRHYLKSQGYHF